MVFGGCSKGPGKGETIGIHFLKKGILTKQGTYIMAILGTGILNNCHLKAKFWVGFRCLGV